jgi:hypothetical protein
MGWQRWLVLGATFAQPILSFNGLMNMNLARVLGFICALNAALLALRMKPNQ